MHYQVSLAEFFDHALTYSYEFNPRGESVNWMHDQYPKVLVTGKQPFLNIAKSVYQITEEWALPKDDAMEALALARILRGLEQLGFAARKQICSGIRYLIHRVISTFEGGEQYVSTDLSNAEIVRLLNAIAAEPTATRGILEQRAVDAVQWCRHPGEEGWKVSSIGESVNATNLSGLKFGDCEFVNINRNSICAFEVHAGTLRDLYIEDHLETLSRVYRRRLPILQQQFDIENLTCEITFIAHQIDALTRYATGDEVKFSEVAFRLQFQTFEDAFKGAEESPTLSDAYRVHMALVLNNEGRTLTPQFARDRLLALLK